MYHPNYQQGGSNLQYPGPVASCSAVSGASATSIPQPPVYHPRADSNVCDDDSTIPAKS